MLNVLKKKRCFSLHFFKVKVKRNFQMFIDVQTFSYFVSSSFPVPSEFLLSSFPVFSQFLPSFFPVPSQFLLSSFPVPSQFHPSYFPKLIRAKVHGGTSEGGLYLFKMSFLKSILKQNAVYQSNFQMSRQCLQRSDVFYLTLQRFTVSTYIGDGLQSEDFQTFSSKV